MTPIQVAEQLARDIWDGRLTGDDAVGLATLKGERDGFDAVILLAEIVALIGEYRHQDLAAHGRPPSLMRRPSVVGRPDGGTPTPTVPSHDPHAAQPQCAHSAGSTARLNGQREEEGIHPLDRLYAGLVHLGDEQQR